MEGPLSEACRRFERFEVCLAQFKHFRHGRGRYTLWLAPEPTDTLCRLQAALQSAVRDCNDQSSYPSGFTPHLSVGQARGDASAAKLEQALQASWRPLYFVAACVSLIWRAAPPDDRFRVDRSLNLGD
jgi:2'-5' RNA ligase